MKDGGFNEKTRMIQEWRREIMQRVGSVERIKDESDIITASS